MEMLRYIVQTRELYDILDVLYDVLGISVSFYDVDFQEFSFLNKKKLAPYCRYSRKNKTFLAQCKLCDHNHFEHARQTDQVQIYPCHAAFSMGSSPFTTIMENSWAVSFLARFDPRVKKIHIRRVSKLWKYYEQLPVSSLPKLKKAGRLIKLTTEMIVRHRMVAFQSLSWLESWNSTSSYIFTKRITITQLSDLVHRSPSFITHHFKTELGHSPAVYIRNKRLEIARRLLEQGEQVKQVADTLGFYDAFHFSRVFKKYFGKPPLSYKLPVPAK